MANRRTVTVAREIKVTYDLEEVAKLIEDEIRYQIDLGTLRSVLDIAIDVEVDE